MSKPAVDINEIENFLWEFFGESHFVAALNNDGSIKTEAGAPCYSAGTYAIQDLGPTLADFLHKCGVDVDWTDRSRYGKETP